MLEWDTGELVINWSTLYVYSVYSVVLVPFMLRWEVKYAHNLEESVTSGDGVFLRLISMYFRVVKRPSCVHSCENRPVPFYRVACSDAACVGLCSVVVALCYTADD